MSPDERPFDGLAELRFAIRELENLAARLGPTLEFDDASSETALWDERSFAALDLMERTLSDIGTLAAQYVRLLIADRYGRDPLA